MKSSLRGGRGRSRLRLIEEPHEDRKLSDVAGNLGPILIKVGEVFRSPIKLATYALIALALK